MRHSVFGRKLNRTSNERKRLFKNLLRSLILHGQIKTTKAKAKSIQPYIEKLITKAKKDSSLATRRLLLKQVPYNDVVDKLFDIAPLFKSRKGGYTRIIKLSNRLGDNASEVFISFTEAVVNSKIMIPEKVEKKVKEKNAKNETNKTK